MNINPAAVTSVLLPDGAWHAVDSGTFSVSDSYPFRASGSTYHVGGERGYQFTESGVVTSGPASAVLGVQTAA